MDTNTDPVRAREILAHVIATEESKGYAGRFGDEQRHVPEWVALEAIAVALAQQPAAVDEARVRASADVVLASTGETRESVGEVTYGWICDVQRAALTAALAAQQQG